MINENLLKIDENKEKLLLEKYANFYVIFDYWLKLIENGKSVSDFFKKKKYEKIVIYGMASLGKHLKVQLEQHDNIEILYTIERENIDYQNQYYLLKEDIKKLPKPDVIIVTPVMEYESITEKLQELIECPIISIEEVILSI